MPTFITQVTTFFQSALTWILYITVPAVGLTAAWHALMRSTAQDESAVIHHSRALRNTIIYGGLALIAAAIVQQVLGFFNSGTV
jgi:heme/copper-type cytochrome/quinol oxidase subunit 2